MNVSLYEISADFLKALDSLEVDEETGEITNFDAVEALNAQFEDKAESVACYIKNLTAFVDDLKTEEAAMAARRKTAERRVDSVKKYLTSCMESVGKDKVETAKARISFRKSVQVGQVVKALVLLGARKIIVEEVEKDRFVVTTTTEAAHSKKA